MVNLKSMKVIKLEKQHIDLIDNEAATISNKPDAT